MKKITLLLCFFAIAAFGQNPPTITEYVDAGLRVGVITEKPEGYVPSVNARGANVTTFDDRVDYLANCSDGALLTSEDFTGGPTAIIGCGVVLSSAGDACYPAGELEEGFEITVGPPGNATVYIDPADGFGTLDPAVGSNTFVDFTVINFTGGDPVTSTGFDLYSLLGGSSVDIRVIGAGGLIDTVTADVTTTGPVFVGILAAEPIVSLEIEDLSGANVELIAQFLYGSCAPPALNDDPETAASLTVGEVFGDFPVIADNTEATATAIDDPSCGNFTEADLWYSFVVPDSGSVSVESRVDDGSITDTAISIYEGTPGALVEVVCNDDAGMGLFSLAEVEGRMPGEVLYARVWEWNGGSLGTFQMSAYDTPPPANDDPEGAIALTVGSVFTDFPVTASNVSATDTAIEDPSCGNYGGADVWFRVAVPSTGQVSIEINTAGGITDTGMSVYSGEIGALVEVECDDDDGPGLFSLIDLVGQEGGSTLYIRVWEWGGGGFGPFQIAAYSDCAVDGGEIALSNGATEAAFCIDGGADAVDATLGGMVTGMNAQWVITDTAGVIIDLPAPPPFDLTGLGVGNFLLWHLSFEDGLTGAAVGENAGDLMGCFDLSNPIAVELVDEGGLCQVCDYTLEMNDSFGDGWNGAIMDVLVDGTVVLDDVSLDDDPNNNGVQGFLTFPVNSTADVTTVFVDGGGFPGEVSYRILDAEGAEVGAGNVTMNIETNTLIANCPTCFAPSDLMADNVTDVSADLSWTDNNDPTAPEFTVEWGQIGFELGTGTMETGITTTSFSLTGLDAGIEYEYYVTANCAADDASNATGPEPFTTSAPPGDCSYTLEMNDSFGDGWNGAFMDVFRNGVLALNDVSLDDDPNNDGSQGSLQFEILPGDDITAVVVNGGGFPGEISYRILNASFVEVATGNATTNVETGTVTGNCPTCFTPFDLTVTNITTVSADLSWTDNNNPEAMSYDLEWGLQGFALGTGTLEIGATNPFTLAGLTANTAYDFYVTANCTEDDSSEVSGPATFTTALEQAPPGDCEYTLQMLDSFGDGWNGALLNVFRNGQVILFEVSLDDVPGNDGFTSSLPFEILPLDEITTQLVNGGGFPGEISYNILDIDGITVLASGDAANDILPGTLTASCTLSIDDNTLEGFSFYPNPAQDVITLDARTAIEDITIFNLLGQKILQQKVDGVSNYQLNVSAIAKGAYLMQVTTNGKIGVYRILKM